MTVRLSLFHIYLEIPLRHSYRLYRKLNNEGPQGTSRNLPAHPLAKRQTAIKPLEFTCSCNLWIRMNKLHSYVHVSAEQHQEPPFGLQVPPAHLVCTFLSTFPVDRLQLEKAACEIHVGPILGCHQVGKRGQHVRSFLDQLQSLEPRFHCTWKV